MLTGAKMRLHMTREPASWLSLFLSLPRLPCAVRPVLSVGSAERPAAAVAGGFNFANPKSRSFAPALVSMMLAGLRSRCVI